MRVRFLPVLTVLFAVTILQGCISFRNSPVGITPSVREMYSPEYEILGEAEGTSSGFQMFWFYSATPPPSTDEAVADAIRSKGGDNLIEAFFTCERRIYIIGTVTVIRVKGKVIRYNRNTR